MKLSTGVENSASWWVFLSLCQIASPLDQPLSDTLAAISSLYHVLNMDEGAVEPDC